MPHVCGFPEFWQEDLRFSAIHFVAGFRHATGMTSFADRRRESFRRWLEDRDLTVNQVLDHSGVGKTAFYTWLKGAQDSLKDTTMEKIAQAYDTTADEIFSRATPRMAHVVGYIGARAEVHPLDDLREPMYEIEITGARPKPNSDYVGFEVRGFSMPPAQEGWVVLFEKKQLPAEDLIGYPCMVELEDGRRLFKELRRGYTPGRFNLNSWDGSAPIEDVSLTAALPFFALSPGRHGR